MKKRTYLAGLLLLIPIAYSENLTSGGDTGATWVYTSSSVEYRFHLPPALPYLPLESVFFDNDSLEGSPADTHILTLLFDGKYINYTDTQRYRRASASISGGFNKMLSDRFGIELNVPLFLVPFYDGYTIAPAITLSAVLIL